jgi:AcrR family transcriptional regulator
MVRQVKAESRRYRSALRAEQAQDTRRRILEAATALFIERGYAGTTISAVAEAAAVSPETIYVSLGGKRGLLEGVIDTAITAFLGPLRDPDDDAASRWVEIGRRRSPRARLRAWVDFVCEILRQTSPIHAVIRGAADSEPFAVELRHRLLSARLADISTALERYVGDELRPGLTLDQAVQRAGALLSPEMHHLLITELGWSPEEHRRWIGDLLGAEVLRS